VLGRWESCSDQSWGYIVDGVQRGHGFNATASSAALPLMPSASAGTEHSSSSLSTGTKAGIGVGVCFAGVAGSGTTGLGAEKEAWKGGREL
jgi:hypothetical protein